MIAPAAAMIDIMVAENAEDLGLTVLDPNHPFKKLIRFSDEDSPARAAAGGSVFYFLGCQGIIKRSLNSISHPEHHGRCFRIF